MTPKKDGKETVQWGIRHVGALDQVALQTPEELENLHQLDPKLWIALSCPTKGLQFDTRTLELLDSDGDGRIRIQDVTEAVGWTTGLLHDPASLTRRMPNLPLAAIREDTEKGALILQTARKLLEENGDPAGEAISPEQVTKALTEAVSKPFNGDGVLPPYPEFGAEVTGFIDDVMATMGSVQDASGKEGINEELAQKFLAQGKELLEWQEKVNKTAASSPFGDATESAYAAYTATAAKIDDYFIRCQLAAYDPSAATSMNAPEDVFKRLSEMELNAKDSLLLKLPLEKIADSEELSLQGGINPAWRESIQTLKTEVVKPLLGDRDELSYEDWVNIKNAFAPYEAVQAEKPTTEVEKIGLAKLNELESKEVAQSFAGLIEKDLAVKKEIEAMRDIERLTLYHAHLYRFLMNFVSFSDFYEMQNPPIFQTGILYLDSKNCNLCIPVDNIEAHAEQAKLSGLCLAYCTCTRKNSTETMNIVAPITAGNIDLLIPGRHGVFVDAQGNEWDTTLAKLVANPINMREAVFSPYRRVVRLIGAQIQKFTASKDERLMAAATSTINKAAEDPKSAATAAQQQAAAPFDIGKNVGILAAVGLALGAIGTAIASIVSALVSLSWWQYPLIFLGLFVIVSGPSVVLAWLKLRKRTLGPVLDASGWAVNSQIPINLAMGDYLTGVLTLPESARRRIFWRNTIMALVIIFIAAACVFGGWYGYKYYVSHHEAEAVAEAQDSAKAVAPAHNEPQK